MESTSIKNSILAVLATVGSFFANQLGGWDTALLVLICMMAADYITGILRAAVFHTSPKTESGKLSSEASYIGLVRKCMILVLVWVGAMLDKVAGAEYVRTAVALFFIANEGLSILENATAIGLPVPEKLKDVLAQLHGKDGDAK